MLGLPYPQSDAEFKAWFPDEDACLAHLMKLRGGLRRRIPNPNYRSNRSANRRTIWSVDAPGERREGKVEWACLRHGCKGKRAWRSKRDLFVCTECGYQMSILSGTILAGTRLPIKGWFEILWWVAHRKTGLSARSLQQAIGLGSYHTALSTMKRVRVAMRNAELEVLRGAVHVAKIPLTGNACIRGHEECWVYIAQSERIRMDSVSSNQECSLDEFVCTVVEPNSTVHVAGEHDLSRLAQRGTWYRVIQAREDGCPTSHPILNQFLAWLKTEHRIAIRPDRLSSFIDAFVFWHNNQSVRRRGSLFHRLVKASASLPPDTVPAD